MIDIGLKANNENVVAWYNMGGGFLRREKGPFYVLTNKRALVVKDQSIISQCNLSEANAASENRKSHSSGSANVNSYGHATISNLSSHTSGDVVFFVDGSPSVKFENIRDPDGLVNQVEAINRSRR